MHRPPSNKTCSQSIRLVYSIFEEREGFPPCYPDGVMVDDHHSSRSGRKRLVATRHLTRNEVLPDLNTPIEDVNSSVNNSWTSKTALWETVEMRRK